MMLSPNSLKSRADETIIALAKNGSSEAFEELMRRKQSYLRNLFRRLTGDAALADDLAQQTFLQCWNSLSNLRSPIAFPAWFKRIAITTWQKSIRKPDVLENSEEIWELDIVAPKDSIAERMDLDKALSTLPTHIRLCIVLSYREGMSHGEISELTKVPLGTVKSHIKRGSAHLRKLLASYQNDDTKAAAT